MIIHSVTPIEYLIPPSKGPQMECMACGVNGFVEGRSTDTGFQVTRLISTNPQDYLDPRYSPGSVLPRPHSR